MITKETFVKTMEAIDREIQMQEAYAEALRVYANDDSSFFGRFDMVDTTINLLTEMMDDEDDWLAYFVWECDMLRDYYVGTADLDGVPITINDWGDVYDFLRNYREVLPAAEQECECSQDCACCHEGDESTDVHPEPTDFDPIFGNGTTHYHVFVHSDGTAFIQRSDWFLVYDE